MARYIELDEAIRVACDMYPTLSGEMLPWGGLEDFTEAFEKIPTVEVVRCKDCKHLTVHNSPTLYAYCEKCKYRFEPFQTDTRKHYCGLGEPKNDKE